MLGIQTQDLMIAGQAFLLLSQLPRLPLFLPYFCRAMSFMSYCVPLRLTWSPGRGPLVISPAHPTSPGPLSSLQPGAVSLICYIMKSPGWKWLIRFFQNSKMTPTP